jgi:hypothetical protein
MCRCLAYEPLALRKQDVAARVLETPEIRATLDLVATRATHVARLYRCRDCAQLWQGGKNSCFGRDEYVFQVPEISREAWLSEPYADPGSLVVFAEQKRWLAQTRQHGIRPSPPPGRLFFMSPDALDAERTRREAERVSVALHEALAPRGDAQHLESLWSVD